MKKFSFSLMALAMLVLSGCNKDDSGGTEKFTYIGAWQSYMINELGEVGEVVARYGTNEYYITFTETTATMVIEDMPAGKSSITSTYEFKEGCSNIIYFQSAYKDYNLQLVAEITENNQLALLQTCSDWDVSYMYYFNKI